MKSLIIYKGKYGATKEYADWLGADLSFPVISAEEAHADTLNKYDCVIIGSSVYIGKLQIRKWLREYSDILKNKKLYFFVVCGSFSDPRKQSEILSANLVSDVLDEHSNTYFLPGRINIAQLGWTDRFMLKIGSMLEKDPSVKIGMTRDFDLVKRENLEPLTKKIRSEYLKADRVDLIAQ